MCRCLWSTVVDGLCEGREGRLYSSGGCIWAIRADLVEYKVGRQRNRVMYCGHESNWESRSGNGFEGQSD